MEQLQRIWKLLGTPSSRNWPGKGYLNLPLFKEGILKDFGEDDSLPCDLGNQFPNDKYLPETFALLDDLLQICPSRRVTASEALKSDYFTCLPLPAQVGSNE